MGNETKGRPHLYGNRSRTGMPRPVGSGRVACSLGSVTNFTFRIGNQELAQLTLRATQVNRKRGEILRGLVLDYLEGLQLAVQVAPCR